MTRKGRVYPSFEERFWAKVDIKEPNDCWMWLGSLGSSKNGFVYGAIRRSRKDGGELIGAHIASYEINIARVPKGMEVRHICDCPGCVNPNHLELGTHYENMQDMVNRKRFCARPGVLHGKGTKLNEAKVKHIRKLYATGNYTLAKLAARYGVDMTRIHQIVKYRAWKHTI